MKADPIRRVAELERDMARLESELVALRNRVDGNAPPTAAAGWAPPVAPRGPPDWPEPTVDAPRAARGWSVGSETVLKWGGVGLVVLAVGFAVSTAIRRNWIGPELQLAGALSVGFGLIGAGVRLRASRPAWTHALCAGGTLALYTTAASDLFLDQVPTAVAFSSTVAIGLGTMVLARAIRSEWVAGATLLGGSIGWVVITDRESVFLATLAWFVALVAIVIAVSLEREWYATRVSAEAVGVIAFLVLAGETATASERTLVGLAATALAGVLFVVPSIGDLSSTWQRVELQLATVIAPWAFAVAVAAGVDARSDEVIALIAFAIAAATLALAWGLRRRLLRVHVISLGLSASVTISIGLAILLSANAVFVALALQAAGLVLVSRALDRDLRVLIDAIVLGLISGVYVVDQMFQAWEVDQPIGEDIGHLLIIAALAVGIWWHGDPVALRIGAVATLALLLVWLGSVLVHLPQGQAVVSIAWAVVGTVVFLIGAITRRTDAATAGLAVLALTVGKLLTVDLREVDTLWRAGLFFIIGLGLMRLGFLLPGLVRGDEATADDEPTRDAIAAGRPTDPTGRDVRR